MGNELKASELARKVGITRQQIHRLAKAGDIPGAMLRGKQFRFDPDNAGLKLWIKSRVKKPDSKERNPSLPAGNIPKWMAQKPPFKWKNLEEQLGPSGALVFYAQWLNACCELTDMEALSPRAKAILAEHYLPPLAEVFNKCAESLGEGIRVSVIRPG